MNVIFLENTHDAYVVAATISCWRELPMNSWSSLLSRPSAQGIIDLLHEPHLFTAGGLVVDTRTCLDNVDISVTIGETLLRFRVIMLYV